MEIATLELLPSDAATAFALALVCRAAGCRTGEEDRDAGLVLHIVGPKSVLMVLETLLPRLANQLPQGPRSRAIGYALAVSDRLVEHILIPKGAGQAVDAEFRRRFEVLDEGLAGEELDAENIELGGLLGLGFTLFPIALARNERNHDECRLTELRPSLPTA